MSNISLASKLDFFKVEKYEYKNNHIVDTSNCPRPHFCMGLVLEGSATFTDCSVNEDIDVEKGDIIFVPIASRYISKWHGEDKVSYISIHFIFDFSGIFSRKKNFKLQKLTPENFNDIKNYFEYILKNYNEGDMEILQVLSKFYNVLGKILPQLKTKSQKAIDIRIAKAIEYIEENYTEGIPVEILAGISNMSVSRFFPAFKSSVGVTPVEYLNNYRINRAIILLMNDNELTIESISERVGFESSAYFRRVFKKVTGKTPREYRKSSMEI